MSESHIGGFRLPVQKLADTLFFAVPRKAKMQASPPLSTNKKASFVKRQKALFCMMCSAARNVMCAPCVMCPADVMCAPRVKRNTSHHCDRRERHHCAAGTTSLACRGKHRPQPGPPLSTNKKASFVKRQKALFCMMCSAARNMMCTTCVMCPTDVMCAPRVKRNSSHSAKAAIHLGL